MLTVSHYEGLIWSGKYKEVKQYISNSYTVPSLSTFFQVEILQAMKIDDDEPLVRIERGVCKVRLEKRANVFKIAAMQDLKCLFKRCEIFANFFRCLEK